MNLRVKREIGHRFLAVVLSVCMLFATQPNLWDGVMVQAASGTGWVLDESSGKLTIQSDKGMTDWKTWISKNSNEDKKGQVISVEIKDGVKTIVTRAFASCVNLNSITIPDSVSSIGGNAFNGCSSLKSIDLPTDITTIEGYAFISSGLTSIEIPGSVTSIGTSTFQSCTALTSIKIPDSVTTIGASAFWACRSLESVEIPAGVTTINVKAFQDCSKLSKVTFYGRETIPKLSKSFDGTDGYIFKDCKFVKENQKGIYIPCGTRTGYLSTDGWSDYESYINDKHTGLSYVAAGAVVRQSCTACKTVSATATISLKDGADLIYTGNEIKPVQVAYSSDWIEEDNNKPDNTAITYENNINAGTAIAKLTIGGATAQINFTIKSASYTVTLNGNGGKGGTSLTSYAYGTGAKLPADWQKTGYKFAGWYDNQNFTGAPVKEISANDTGNKTFWAKWTPSSYTISYNLDGGNVSGNPTDYTIESSTITLNNPTKEGYTFTGWSGTGLTGEQNTTVTIPKGSTGNRTYTAHWELKGYTVTLHTNGGTGGTDLTAYTYGTVTTLPADWQKTGYVFDGWYVNEDFTGTVVTNILADDTGNKEYWAKWTDNIAPVIGTLSFNYQPKNLWQWLIGKESLVITVPVTEEGSGADKITYTETPDGGTAREETANIQNGEAEITVSADFKGTISIACTDKANNTSASVTVGAGVAPNGIIIEDNAPQIAFTAENAELLPSGEYKSVPNITVTVADDKNNAISGGIASVSYKIGSGSAKTVLHDYTTSMVLHDSFTIPASEIPTGETKITVTATDNAGNSVTQNYTVKVHSHGGTLVQAVEPTCSTAGNDAYYTCTCGKWFSDSGCTNEITDHTEVIKNALGHDFTGEYQFDTEEHWKKCSRCDATDSREAHSFEEGGIHCTRCEFEKAGEGHTHTGELHQRVEPTCTTEGNTAYYTCTCGKWFSDSGCTVEITDHASVAIPALGHDFSGEYQSDASEHWKVCSRCHAGQPKEPHVFDDDNDADCNKCGYRRNNENQGNVSKDVEKDEKAPDTVLSESAEELADIILTEVEKGQIGNGADIKFILDVKDAGDTVSSSDKTSVQQALDGNTVVKGFSVGQYLDINLFKVIGGIRNAISQTARKLTIVINVPESLKSKDGAKPRTYSIIRVHDDVAEALPDLDSDADTVTIATDRFSAYALVYKEAGSGADVTPTPTPGGGDKPTPTPGGSDKPSPTPGGSEEPSPTPDDGNKPGPTPDDGNKPSPTPDGSKPTPTPGGGDNVTPVPAPSEKPEKTSSKEKRKIQLHSGLKVIQTGKKLQISWGRVSGADGYSVYVQYCNKNFSAKPLNQVKSGKKTKITVKKVNGKKLDTTKNFKLYVVAWQWKNGKKSTLAKTLTIHVAGKDSVKYTNVKSIQAGKSSYTLKKGGTVTLHPKAVLYDKQKRQLSVAHCKEFRYLNSNKKIATITAGGKIKAKGTGECAIYIFAKNGYKRKIKVKVK